MEKIKTIVYDDSVKGSKFVAEKIRDLIESRNKKKQKTKIFFAIGIIVNKTSKFISGNILKITEKIITRYEKTFKSINNLTASFDFK